MSDDTLLYFAYGSNMYGPRMKSRVPSARFYDIGRLPGYCLAFCKQGRDGSAKADLDPFEPETVWGVIYCIDADERHLLDAAEGEGYKAIEVTVAAREDFVDVLTYRAKSDWIIDGLPYSWYRDMVVAGAKEHELPEVYVAAIAEMDATEDPDPERAAQKWG
jgi:cation transport regulator ChaC